MQERLKAFVRHPVLLKAVIALLFGTAVIVGLMILQLFVGGQNQQQAAKKAGIVSVPLDGITPTEAGIRLDSLQVNGTLQIGDSIVLTPSSRPANPTAGQQYYDLNDQTLYYWNGASWVAVGQQNLDPVLGLIASLQAKDGQLDQVDAATAARINQLQAAIEALQASQPSGSFVQLQSDTPGTQQTGNVNVSGTVIAGSFQGSGAGLTDVNAAQLNGQNGSFYQNAANLNAGTLNDARLSGNVTLQGNTFNGANQLLQLDGTGKINDARLSANVALENTANTFTQANTFSQGVISTRNGVPAGGNGALNGLIFYDTVTSKFYAYENGSAKELCNKADLGCGNDGASVSLQTAYNNGNTVIATDARDIKFTLANTATDPNFILDIIDAGQFKIQDNGTDRVTITRAGDVTATSFAGNGANLSALNASNVSSGTLADARLSSNVTLQGNIFNAANRLLQLNGSGQVNDSLLSVNVAFLNGTQAFSGANTFSNASNSFTGSGAGLTSLNASNVSSGTLSDARLSSNVALMGGNNTFTGTNRFDTKTGFGQAPSATGAAVQVAGGVQTAGTTSGNNTNLAGTIIYDTTDGKFKIYESASGILKTLCNSIDGCATAGGAVTLQGAYDNSASPALITTTAVGKTVGIRAGTGFNSTTLFNVQDASGGSVLAVDSVNNKVVVSTIEGNGAGLTNLNASNVSTGTLADARLSGNVTLQGNTFNGAGQLVQLDGSSRLPAVSGALLTNLNAGALATGTVADARLSTNVALENISNTFSADQRFDGKVSVGQAASATGAAVQVAGGVQTAGTTSGNNTNLAGTLVYDTTDGKYKIYEGASGVLKTLCNQTDGNCGGAGGGASLQTAYDTGNTIATTNARDISFTLADTATDSNFLVNIASGSAGKVAFQSNGQDKLTIQSNNVTVGAGSNPTLLVLDNVPTASLPTGVNGGLIYDSTVGKFLMYENGAYKQLCNQTDGNCGGSGGGASLQTAYNTGNTITTTDARDISFTLANTTTDANFALDVATGSTGKFSVRDNGTENFSVDKSGNVTANGTFTGTGSGLTNLNASNVSSGTLADARLTSNVALLDRASQIFTGTNQLFRNTSDSATAFRVQNAAGTQTPFTVDTVNNKVVVTAIEGNGSGLTNLNASNVSSGTLADARLSGNVTLQGNTFNGANQLVKLDGTGALPAISGANLTALNASNISSGTLSDGRLSSNVALKNQDNAFSTSQTVTGTVSATSFTANGNAGATVTCSGGQFLQNATSVGGIVTGGACATPAGATSTLQDVYNNDTAGQPADIVTTAASKTLLFKAGSTFDSTALFDVQNAAGTSQFKVDTTNSKVVMVNGEFSGNVTVTGGVVAATFSGNGSGITSLNASNVSSGTLNDARLSSNVALKNINNSFSAAQSITANGGKTTLALTSTGADTGITIGGDTTLYRSAADTLKTDDMFVSGGPQDFVTLTSGAAQHVRTSAASAAIQAWQFGDANVRYTVAADGYTSWGNGTAVADTTLYRADAGRLRTDAKLEVGTSLGIGVYDPSNARIALGGSGSSNGIVFGAGAAGSANLYKDGLSDALLKTDSSFQIDTRLGLGTDPTAGTARLQFANGTTAAGGIQFGSDTNLYRADTNQLKTDDTFDAAAYKVAGTAGASTTCTGGDVLTNQVVAGGIVTGGTCSAAATTTLQGAYNNDASGRADIVTTSAAKTVLIQAGSGFNSASLFEVQNASGGTVFVADSINNRVAIGKATADYTVDANGDINVASGVYRVAGTAGTSFGGTCGSGNVITNVSVSGGIVTGVTCAANSNTMQQAYDAGNTVLTTNARDISYTLANTATDANFNVNVASGSTSKFAVQYNGAETFSVGNTGQTVAAFAGNTPETQSWGSTTSMSNGQGGGFATGVTYNGYVYHIGGWDTLQNGARSQVTYARLNADGTVPASGQTGTWALTTSMPAARIVTGAAAANGYLYVIGGSTGGNNNGSNTTYYAKINKDGTLGSWTTASVALPANRASHSVSYYNGYLYVIGGTPTGANWTDGASGTSTVYYARVNADGSIGTWQSNANSLPQARIGHASVAANGYLYAIGGSNTSSVIQSTVYYAKVNANGSTGAWASVGSSLNTARMHMGAVVMNGAAYVVGGLDSSNAISSIEYALLNANGTMGSWANSSNSLPAARQGAPAVAANGYILALSGYDTSSSTVNTVYRVSTPRLAIAGSLDLVSAIGENLAEGGSGGALTAGNTNVVGDLGVAGQANIDGGASVGGALAVNGSVAVRAAADAPTTFQVLSSAGTTPVLDVDTTNSRTGINTNAPATALHIGNSGTAVTDGIQFSTDTNLYRSAANTLSTGTGDSFNVTNNLQTGGTTRISSTGALSNVSFGSAVGALVTNSSGTISSTSGATSGLCLMSNGSSTAPSFQACPAGSSGWALSGNTVGGTDFLGSTNDADVVFKTSDVERLRIYHQNNGGSIQATIRSGQGEKVFLRTDSQDIIKVDTSTPKLQMYLRGSVGGTQVCTSGGGNAVQDIGTCSSSAAYKDDIIPFEQDDYQAVLQKIADTEIYNYKHKTDRPGTQRYGLISENMPSELTYLDPNGYPTPDWFSVYGYMWAGIRALNEKIDQSGATQGTEIKLTGAETTEPGELVTLHPTDAQTLIKTTKAYDPGVTGIARGGSSSAEQGVATSGIVDVKVTNQNGPIAIGDYLAASDTPGHAMKTTQAGMAIGRAVAPFDGTTGTVKVLLNVGFYNPSNLTQSTSALTASEASQFADFTTQTLVVTGSAEVATITVAGNADVKGALTVGKGLQVSDSVTLDANNRGIDAIVEEGADELAVRFNKPQADNQYSIQVEPNWLTDTAVVEKTNEGFTVRFEKAAPERAKLDWLLIR